MRTQPALAATAITFILASGCSGKVGSTTPKTTPTPASSVVPAPGVTVPAPLPRRSGRDAVSALLTAEQHNDHAASFLLLSSAARAVYPSPADWARRRAELPAVTGFTLSGGALARTVTAAVTHQPGVDPFVGLSTAQDKEVWHVRQEAGGWLVDGDPDVTLDLPPDAGATPGALAWATAVQRCDQAGTRRQQAVDRLLGTSDGASMLCHSTGTLSAGTPTTVPSGPPSAELVAQYTTDSLSWARAVRITGGPLAFSVILAPIGTAWKAVGVFD